MKITNYMRKIKNRWFEDDVINFKDEILWILNILNQ